jgi:DNA-binding transcriptional MerR regulator
MKIGELARQAGVPIDTVRYYERNGLLPEPARRESGYRDYAAADVARLGFVLRAKALGFSLAEVRELSALLHDAASNAGDLRALAQARLSQIEDKLAELVRLRDGLRAVIDACPGAGPVEACPIRAAVVQETSA